MARATTVNPPASTAAGYTQLYVTRRGAGAAGRAALIPFRWPCRAALGFTLVAAVLWLTWGTVASVQAASLQAVVSEVRATQPPQADRTRAGQGRFRVTVDLSAPAAHRIFTLPAPPRLVVDLVNTRLDAMVRQPSAAELIKQVRAGVRNGSDLRLVFDLVAPVEADRFELSTGEDGQHRLVVDIRPASGRATAGAVEASSHSTSTPRTNGATNGAATAAAEPKSALQDPVEHYRDAIVVIDPGHGGKDFGATGRNGTHEKDVVLAIGKYLEALIDEQPGMQALLTRSDDSFVPLRKRMARARAKGADVFISVHADAFKDNRARGSSVYILSQGGASSEAARWLAERENAADLVGGVSLSDKDRYLKMTLLDLSQTATSSASSKLARSLLRQLNDVGHVKRNRVERAGFVVLKSPDIPSVLVETAFISNAKDEKRLRNPKHQRKLAAALAKGIVAYIERHPPQGTLLAAREHIIERGDTLSGIASRYGVPISALRTANDMEGSLLRTGQRLRIPIASDG